MRVCRVAEAEALPIVKRAVLTWRLPQVGRAVALVNSAARIYSNLVPYICPGSRKGTASPVSRADGLPLLLVKPPEAYMMFKFSLQSANPGLTPEELQQVAVREWRAISNAERRRYISEADKTLARHKRDCADFFLEDMRRKEQYAADVKARKRVEARQNQEGGTNG